MRGGSWNNTSNNARASYRNNNHPNNRKDLATREVMFFHQLVQEYFAARRLARAPEPQRVQTAWRAASWRARVFFTLSGRPRRSAPPLQSAPSFTYNPFE